MRPCWSSLRAKRSNPEPQEQTGLLRRYAARNDAFQPDIISLYRRNIPPTVPRTIERPTELPREPPTDLPRFAATPPITLLVTERVRSRAITWPVDSLCPRGRLVPKIIPTMLVSCPSTPPSPADAPPAAVPAGAAVPATRFCSTS